MSIDYFGKYRIIQSKKKSDMFHLRTEGDAVLCLNGTDDLILQADDVGWTCCA